MKTATRCFWANNELEIAYHDREWGVPLHDDDKLFELLILEGAQAGLSWDTILRKREHYRAAYDGFDPRKVAKYGKREIARMLNNEGIVRNRAKIGGVIVGARAYLELMAGPGFSNHLWSFVGGQPIINHLRLKDRAPAETEISRAMSKD